MKPMNYPIIGFCKCVVLLVLSYQSYESYHFRKIFLNIVNPIILFKTLRNSLFNKINRINKIVLINIDTYTIL